MKKFRTLCVGIVSLFVIAIFTVGQDKQQPSEDVIRITTELVQTSVVVTDKQGKFVSGLKPEQFALKVDGKPVTPSFLEHVIAGSMREEKLDRSVANREAVPAAAATDSTYRGRTIIFFIDDLHLSADSVQRTKKGIMDFVEQEMSLEDQVAVVSPSGQIGFLQRFSDLKPVVRAAANRLVHKPYTVRDYERVPMTEYQAIRIEQGDSATIDYFANELVKANNITVPGGVGPPQGGPMNRPLQKNQQTTGMNAESAKRVVRDRASILARQTEAITAGTLSSLESLMRSVGQVPGRKLVFLISDGFFLNDHATGYANKINRISNAAVLGGLVIYSVDARGGVNMTDASSNRADGVGQLSRGNIGEVTASQDGLNALAVDTGGKAYFSVPITSVVTEALRETSNYYLLAWRPSTDDQKSSDFKRLEVSIVGRPDLTVRLPRGFFLTEPKEDKKNEAANEAVVAKDASTTGNKVESALMTALAAPSSRVGLPTKLSVSFVDVPGSGPVMTAATQMSTENLGYGDDEKHTAAIDLAGLVLNDQGKQAGSFKTRVNVSRMTQASATGNASVVYSHKVPLKPGIYQVRVAARDDKSGRVGSAAQWIEIPELGSKKLMLSTLLLGQAEQVQFSVDRRFPKESQMTFLTIIYNAAAGGGGPKLDSQIEILRGGQRVIASPVRPITIEPNTDLARIPYGGGVSLKSLAPGRYALKVTINDRNANVTTANQILFEVE